MSRLIKKYKNRRLYDTEISQYITIDTLQNYVVEGIPFKVEDSDSGKDLTNSTLLQILVEMEAGATQFLSPEVLRQIIYLANHPMHQSYKQMLENMFSAMDKSIQGHPYQEAAEAWNKQMKAMMDQWQNFFKKS